MTDFDPSDPKWSGLVSGTPLFHSALELIICCIVILLCFLSLVPQDDGPHPVVPISYSKECKFLAFPFAMMY
jgi:hypothetical protein